MIRKDWCSTNERILEIKESLCFILQRKQGGSEWSVIFSGPEPDATDGLRFQFHHLLAAETITCLHDIFLGDGTKQEGIVGDGRLRHDTLGHALDDALLNQVVQPASIAEILIALGSGFRNQGVGFVDEEYASPGLLNGLPDVLFCLTDVFAYQLCAACLYGMSAGK